jgi:lipoic acid synthetase
MPRFSILNQRPRQHAPKPPWLKVRAPSGERYQAIRKRMADLRLTTVCQEAQCPNIGECWDGGTATIMLMGDTCTRGCRFCAVQTGKPLPLDPNEPAHAAEAVAAMGVDYIVLTSVNRDDLSDGGAAHIAETVRELKRRQASLLVEVLIPDFQGLPDAIDTVIAAGPEVVAHNVETIPRLTPMVRDARASFDVSIQVLARVAKAAGAKQNQGLGTSIAKTSIMLGVGETEEEVKDTLHRLREVGTHVVTFGQYLQPSPRHLEVVEYIEPERFDAYAHLARDMGFLYVASGPLVRSSYRAGEFYLKSYLSEVRSGANGGVQ